MKTTYWIWKNPHCNGVNPDWKEINGREFYTLVNTPENKGRRFVKLPKTEENECDIVMESTETEYVKWKKEKNHADYLRSQEHEISYQVISYHAIESSDGCFGEEIMRDENCNIESECFKKFEREAVIKAIARLSDDERNIIDYFYLSGKQGSERDFAEKTGITKSSVNRRKIAVLRKLKKYLSE